MKRAMLKRVLGRVLLVCTGIAVGLLAAEALAYVGYWAVGGHRFSRDDYHSEILERMASSGAPSITRRPGEDNRGVHTVIHPYLGFVPAPDQVPGGATIGDASQIPRRSDRELVVAVLGGSFAAGVCSFAAAELRRGLATPEKGVRLLCMAAGGYKQPQQLLTLAYLLAQGVQPDVVLNIDGFNEVALPPVDNQPQGVNPIYPRGWFWQVGNLEDPGALKLLGELSLRERGRRNWAAIFVGWGLDRSVLLTLAWESRDRLFEVERNRILTEIRDHKIEQRNSYAATGPPMNFADDQAYYAYLARVWKDSSRQMKVLCDANAIAYRHFLQPNQFVEGSKPMGPEELRLVARPGSYGRPVVLGYPHLREQGAELEKAGVRFHDLTMVFKDVPDRLYSDGCCHLNADGYNRIARVIGELSRRDENGHLAAVN